MNPDFQNAALILRAGEHAVALDLSHVVEIMRPQPIRELRGAPDAVCGLAIIRGEPVPVVALARVLGRSGSPAARFVLLRAGARRVAVAVDAVLGIRNLDAARTSAMPPLLQEAARDAIEAVGALDTELLFVLNSGRIVPDEVWQTVETQEP